MGPLSDIQNPLSVHGFLTQIASNPSDRSPQISSIKHLNYFRRPDYSGCVEAVPVDNGERNKCRGVGRWINGLGL